MPYTERKTKGGGVTVTSKDSGKSFHASSKSAAHRDERLHEMFKHMKANHTLFKK